MAYRIDNDILEHKSRRDVLVWLGAFLIGGAFAGATWKVWTAPEHIHIHSWFAVAFTIVSALIIAYLLKGCLEARLTRSTFNRRTGEITIRLMGLTETQELKRTFKDIKRVEFRSLNTDGEFYRSVIVFKNSLELMVAHGNYKPHVLKEQHEMVMFLKSVRPDLMVLDVDMESGHYPVLIGQN